LELPYLGSPWPMALLPVVVLGVVALRHGSEAIESPRHAALAGALAGLVASPLYAVAAALRLIPSPPAPYTPQAGLALTILQDAPFSIPLDRLLFDLPFLLPFPWPYSHATPDGGRVSQMLWTLALMPLVGPALA